MMLVTANGFNRRANWEYMYFWYLWLAIQNTANRHVSSAFDLLDVFISLPRVRGKS